MDNDPWTNNLMKDEDRLNIRSISGASGGAFNMVGRYCDSRSICGWEIYGDLRRHIYYLRNQ
ncbi:hypothetical protein E2C01_068255 [Portunus trituberculatus]|uniref:Uncharacterized protein n=1 Tax=Portunus trituberculatus TaxID=210409 RepID=A0A5B7HVA8_PORTR|nr:hypothetical protein [Portunus trituberculatus]